MAFALHELCDFAFKFLTVSFSLHLQTFLIHNNPYELFVPDADAVQKAWQENRLDFPYWSQVWPAAIALAEFIIEQKQYVQDALVLELAGGLGLPSIVAARFARTVLCTDSIPEAVEAVRLTAEHLSILNLQTAVLDWHRLPQHHHPFVLLLSDINYKPEDFPVLKEVIENFLQIGSTILLSTPERLAAKSFIEPLLSSCIFQQQRNVLHQGREVPVSILVLQAAPSPH